MDRTIAETLRDTLDLYLNLEDTANWMRDLEAEEKDLSELKLTVTYRESDFTVENTDFELPPSIFPSIVKLVTEKEKELRSYVDNALKAAEGVK